MSSFVAVCSFECTNSLSVDFPTKRCRTPIKRVGVKFRLGRVNSRLRATIVVSSNTFSKVVGLHLATGSSKIVSGPFPINFIQVIRHQDCTTDNTNAWCCLHNNFNTTKEEIEICPDIWCFIPLAVCEFSTVGAIFDGCIVGKDPAFWECRLFSEVDRVLVRVKARIWRAGCCSSKSTTKSSKFSRK